MQSSVCASIIGPSRAAILAMALVSAAPAAPVLAGDALASNQPTQATPAAQIPPATPTTGASANQTDVPAASADSPSAALTGWTADAWTIDVRARVWYVAPAGTVNMPSTAPGATSIMLDTLNLDSPRAAPAGDVTVRIDGEGKSGDAGSWFFCLSGAGVGESTQSVALVNQRVGNIILTAGDVLDAKLDYFTFHGVVGYTFWQTRFGPTSDENTLRLSALGGVRYNSVEFTLARTSGAPATQTFSTSAAEIIGGLRLEQRILRVFSADLDVLAGGLSSSTSGDLAVSLGYRPAPWISGHIGYRLLANTIKDGDGDAQFKFDGSYAGLFAGVSLRF